VRVRLTPEAQGHIRSIHTYISKRSPTAAVRVVTRIKTAANRLCDNPFMGRKGPASGTHEWVVTGLPYIIVYEPHIETDELIVLGVYHGAQMRPGQK
jgi:toxin ParE1/3/4